MKQSPPPNREKPIPKVEIREELIMGNGFAESKLYYKHKGKWKLLVHRKA